MVFTVLEVIAQEFSVCKIHDTAEIDFSAEFCFVGRTDEELSLVCGTASVPKTAAARDDGWCAFRILGVLDFSLIGILAKISALLADANIGIFAVSTYNTDYIFTKKDRFEAALSVLKAAGYEIRR